MTVQPSDLYDMLMKIRYDTTAIQAKVSDALKILTELNLPTRPQHDCPECGLPVKGPRTLAEHLHQSHGGPLPEHWEALDSQVAGEARAHARPSPDPDAALTSEGT